MKNAVTNVSTLQSGFVNQYEITKSNRFGYGSVFAVRYPKLTQAQGLAEPTGRWGCLVPGTRPDKGSIEATYCNIYESSNKWANAGFPYVPFSESYEYGDVRAVFNMYIRGVREGACPEYYPTGQPPKNKVRVDSEGVVNYLVPRLQSNLAKYTDPKELIRTFFYIAGDLHRQDLAGNTAYINPTVLFPATYDDRSPNATVSKYYDKIKSEIEKREDKSIFSGANDFMSNLLTIIVVGGAIYFIAPLLMKRR